MTQHANDNAPTYDPTGGVDGYRIWLLKANGKRACVVAEFKTLSNAARWMTNGLVPEFAFADRPRAAVTHTLTSGD